MGAIDLIEKFLNHSYVQFERVLAHRTMEYDRYRSLTCSAMDAMRRELAEACVFTGCQIDKPAREWQASASSLRGSMAEQVNDRYLSYSMVRCATHVQTERSYGSRISRSDQ